MVLSQLYWFSERFADVVGLGPYTFKRLCKLSVIPHLFEKGYILVDSEDSEFKLMDADFGANDNTNLFDSGQSVVQGIDWDNRHLPKRQS